MIKILAILLSLSAASYGAVNNNACLLDGHPDHAENAQAYGEVKTLFRGFESVWPEDAAAVESAIKTFNGLPEYLQQVIFAARSESSSTGLHFEGAIPSLSELVTYMDYLMVYDVEFMNPKSGAKENLYLVDIAVGGGNGAYLYYKRHEQGGYTRLDKLYEDFDGDVEFCASAYEKAN